MKAFYIIIFVFFVMIGGILFNKAKVNDFTSNAIEQISSIKSDDTNSEAQTREITDSILKELEKLEFSIPRKRVNMIFDYARLLVTQCRLNNFTDFEMTRDLLIGQLQEIDDAERISFSNIV